MITRSIGSLARSRSDITSQPSTASCTRASTSIRRVRKRSNAQEIVILGHDDRERSRTARLFHEPARSKPHAARVRGTLGR